MVHGKTLTTRLSDGSAFYPRGELGGMSRLHTGTQRDARQRRRVERQHVVEIIVPKLLLKVKGSGIGDLEQAPERLSSILFGIQGVRALL